MDSMDLAHQRRLETWKELHENGFYQDILQFQHGVIVPCSTFTAAFEIKAAYPPYVIALRKKDKMPIVAKYLPQQEVFLMSDEHCPVSHESNGELSKRTVTIEPLAAQFLYTMVEWAKDFLREQASSENPVAQHDGMVIYVKIPRTDQTVAPSPELILKVSDPRVPATGQVWAIDQDLVVRVEFQSNSWQLDDL